MRYWWVNQNQTYAQEVGDGFLWSPKVNKNGARNQFYDNMREVKAGDIVFSFCDTRIKALGIAKGEAQTATKPNFGSAGENWSAEGWHIDVDFKELKNPIRPKDSIHLLVPHLQKKYAPIAPNGNGKQAVYLAEVTSSLAQELAKLLGGQYVSTLTELQSSNDVDVIDDKHEDGIKGRTDIDATTKAQLVKSRRGQGQFKANVSLNEQCCRVTGVDQIKHLRASHIKPWRKSSDEEKLNGCNGLLLAPHIDHLFDQGFISFTDRGDLLISSLLEEAILLKWGVDKNRNVGVFKKEQIVFLDYHRNHIFKK